MATMLQIGRSPARSVRPVILLAILCATSAEVRPQSAAITITLKGQSMIGPEIRATGPAAVPVIEGLLKGEVMFTNLLSLAGNHAFDLKVTGIMNSTPVTVEPLPPPRGLRARHAPIRIWL